MQQLSKLLIKNRITVSSYAIGPQRNIEFLASLANNTGGRVFVDAVKVTGQQAGAALAAAANSAVVWPKHASISELGETYPKHLVPLRSDRDSILLGTLAENVPTTFRYVGELNGAEVKFQWQVAAQPSS